MALSFSGAGQSLAWGSAIATAVPVSMSCWVNMNSFTSTPVLMTMGDSTNNNVFEMVINTTGKPIAQTSLAGSAAQAISATTVSTGVWTMITAVFASATSRIIYVNGGSAVSNATSKTPSGINNAYIASVGTNHLANGSIAYPAFWNTALSPTDVSNLYNSGSGVDPSTIQAANVLNFPKLQSGPPYVDSITAGSWTVTGSPSIVADPFSLTSTTEITPSALSSSAASVTLRLVREISASALSLSSSQVANRYVSRIKPVVLSSGSASCSNRSVNRVSVSASSVSASSSGARRIYRVIPSASVSSSASANSRIVFRISPSARSVASVLVIVRGGSPSIRINSRMSLSVGTDALVITCITNSIIVTSLTLSKSINGP